MSCTVADLHLRSDRRLATMGLVILAVPSIWFVRTDVALFSGHWPELTARLGVRLAVVGILLVGVALVLSASSRPVYSRRMFAVALTLALAFLAMSLQRPAESGLPMRTAVFSLSVMYATLSNSRWRQIIPPLALSAGLVVLEAAWLNHPGNDLAGDLLVFAVVNAAGMLIVHRRLALEGELGEAWRKAQEARAELRTLRGIIPICGYCKSVRSELGDWQQIERYVREHSDAEFSHGICPACLQRHFPEVNAGDPQRA